MNQPPKSKTPLTDAAILTPDIGQRIINLAHRSRSLEFQLNEALAKLAKAERTLAIEQEQHNRSIAIAIERAEKLAEVTKDKERLDWLAASHYRVSLAGDWVYSNFRTAIDAAMNGDK